VPYFQLKIDDRVSFEFGTREMKAMKTARKGIKLGMRK